MSTVTPSEQAGVIEGLRRKERALRKIDLERANDSLLARRIMARTALERGTTTIDDVRDQLALPEGRTNLGRCWKPLVSAGVLSVLRPIPSRRRENNGRLVVLLALASRERALEWLDRNPAPDPPREKKATQRELPGLLS